MTINYSVLLNHQTVQVYLHVILTIYLAEICNQYWLPLTLVVIWTFAAVEFCVYRW